MQRAHFIDLLLLGAIWGAAFPFIRVAVPEFGPIPLVTVRIVLAATLLFSLAAARGQLGEMRGRWGAFTVIGALNTAVPFALFAFATRTVPASMSAVLNATTPLFGAVVGGLFFQEKLGQTRTIGLALGFAGVLVLMAGDLKLDGGPLAMAAALLGASMYALAAHLTRRMFAGVPSLVIAAGSLVASAGLLILPAIALWPATMPSTTAWLSAAFLAVIGTAFGYIVYFRLLERAGPTSAMAVTYLIPLFGMLWSAIFLSEQITTAMLIGCACIFAGIAVTTGVIRTWAQSRRPPPSP